MKFTKFRVVRAHLEEKLQQRKLLVKNFCLHIPLLYIVDYWFQYEWIACEANSLLSCKNCSPKIIALLAEWDSEEEINFSQAKTVHSFLFWENQLLGIFFRHQLDVSGPARRSPNFVSHKPRIENKLKIYPKNFI